MRNRTRKLIALKLLMIMIFQVASPTVSLALTGGPSQPEVQGFEPVGTSDMVDMFSGDFTYNIPLLDVDGYPINISYHSGISMDQEASWIGLGWNLNPGVVNRNMRGLPDDFNGEQITRVQHMLPNKTYGITAGVNIELFGKDIFNEVGEVVSHDSGPATLGYSLGIKINNYNGVGFEKSLTPGINSTNDSKFPWNASLGITSSSDNGISVQPEGGLSTNAKKYKDSEVTLGLKIGVGFNSRQGLGTLSIGTSISMSKDKEVSRKSKTSDGEARKKTLRGRGTFGGVGTSFSGMMPTYTPSVGMNMHNFSISGKVKVGLAFIGVHGNGYISGSYSSQAMQSNSRTNSAYGYLYAQNSNSDNDLLDFNRENDGSFTQTKPALPLTNFTYDTYSVSGQGVGGSYRPFRSNVGFVYDSKMTSTSSGFPLGLDFGLGNTAKFGASVGVNHSNSTSRAWRQENDAAFYAQHKTNNGKKDFEYAYFKEANEKNVESDPGFFTIWGGYEPKNIKLQEQAKFSVKAKYELQGQGGIARNVRTEREKRNQLFSYLTVKETQKFALDENYASSISAQSKDHHIGEISTLSTDGSRYIYGLPAYNTVQKEVTFAIGRDKDFTEAPNDGTCTTGLVTYYPNKEDNSTKNKKGLDNYYEKTTTPAYAHSYLLTSVISPDYVDSDNIPGPSDGDLGNYSKFTYSKVSNYKWRVPFEGNKANFNEGLKSDVFDDKASYIYGEKDLFYLNKVESKNHIAVFHTSNRNDARGVHDEDGGIGASSGYMKKLDSISLYSKPDFLANGASAVPIKRVHFVYDYSLCPNVSNNAVTNGGKLTLKEVYFTYEGSKKAKFSGYKFAYDNINPEYNLKGYDRWGNYKPNNPGGCGYTNALSAAEYPYVTQDKTLADSYAAAWTLSKITLPSGGNITMEYESDDYAYVQNKQAMQMFKIVGVEGDASISSTPLVKEISSGVNKNKKLYFELQPGHTDNIQSYIKNITEPIYFRCLTRMHPQQSVAQAPDSYDYVSGYADIDAGEYGITNIGGTNVGWVKLKSVTLNDRGSTADYNPITLAGIQFARLHLPRLAWGDPSMNDNNGFIAFIKDMVNTSIVANMIDAFKGPNKTLWQQDVGTEIIVNKSWVRLHNPNYKKLGGGVRVKKVIINDDWKNMTNQQMDDFDYGQEYFYDTNGDGTGKSSGVATYEPQLGGDENPFKQPLAYEKKNRLAPDDRFYIEEPLGESFFPSPSVGYSKVVVRNLQHTGVSRTATGHVEHRFYTAKDFPTLVKRTQLKSVQEGFGGSITNSSTMIKHKTSPFSITSLLKLDTKDYLTASQGFVVELNDMHGKPASQSVYAEGQTTPITKVEYRYKREVLDQDKGIYGNLVNEVDVIYPDGSVQQARVGVFFDVVADFRESTSKAYSGSVDGNLDNFIWPFLPTPLAIPSIWPGYSKETTQFRSAVLTKVIQRFGILEETIATDLGSIVKTKNLAYDSETGDVLLTETATNFEDPIYSLNFPAYWYYREMGPAYKNIGFTAHNLSFDAQGRVQYGDAQKYFIPGDELIVSPYLSGTSGPPDLSNAIRGWVVDVGNGYFDVVDKQGNPVIASSRYVKVIRSGNRNMQAGTMASITLMSNPLNQIKDNLYEKVIQASAIEYGNDWKTYCNCFSETAYSSNPYILGIKGYWKPLRSYLHLTSRSQTDFNRNTHIRKDGMFGSYTPYYRHNGNTWEIDPRDWTFTSEITEFSPFGAEIENRDALGRYSAATFGYNQTLALAVGANTRYREIGFDNFEDYSFNPCADDHFKFDVPIGTIVSSEAHSGRYSLRVTSGTDATMGRQITEACDADPCPIDIFIEGACNESPSYGCYIFVSGGTGPYTVTPSIYSGVPQIVPSPGANNDEFYITITGNSIPWDIDLEITDSKGCKVIKRIN